MKHKNEDNSEIYYYATRGLLNYKLKNLENGRLDYQKAIQLSDKKNEKLLSIKALLNFAIAEKEAMGVKSINFVQKALEISKNIELPDIEILRDKLEKTKSGFLKYFKI